MVKTKKRTMGIGGSFTDYFNKLKDKVTSLSSSLTSSFSSTPSYSSLPSYSSSQAYSSPSYSPSPVRYGGRSRKRRGGGPAPYHGNTTALASLVGGKRKSRRKRSRKSRKNRK
jgi:hypothetical protein